MKTAEFIITMLTIISMVFGGFAFLLRQLKGYILGDFQNVIKELNESIKDLRDDLSENAKSRKEHEGKLFEITDTHTRDIASLKGRVKTIEVINKIDSKEEY